jgi:folate-binding protein YgfZ
VQVCQNSRIPAIGKLSKNKVKSVSVDLKRVELTDWGVIRVAGADTVKFLQGQLSNDMEQISAERSVLAGYHNPQGRAVALLRMVKTGSGDIAAVLPRELVADVISRLRKFVLRSKVSLTDESDSVRVVGIMGADVVPDVPNASWLGVEGVGRRLIGVLARDAAHALTDLPEVDRSVWTQLDIQEGVPQIYKATSEAFVAQMLNLDVLGGIAFDKGCYTGQEVIARAHYRGRVKRRMQRLRTNESMTLARGDAGRLQDGRSFKVVEALQLADGRCEFLAIAPMVAGHTEEASEAGASPAIAAEQMPLPYSLPE